MGKRAKRRAKITRVSFGQIVYYREKTSGDTHTYRPSYEFSIGGKLMYKRRNFSSYEAALSLLTEVKLGLIVDHGYRYYKAYKLVGGYIRKGRRVITTTKIVAKREIKYERAGVRRNEFSDRLFCKQWGTSVLISQAVEVADRRWSIKQHSWRPMSFRSYRSSNRSVRTTPVVRHRIKPVAIPECTGSRYWGTISDSLQRKRTNSLQRFSTRTIARTK